MVGHIVHGDAALGIAIVGCRDGAESLLASRVPDLHFNEFVINLQSFDFEVDSNCVLHARLEDLVYEAHQK